MSSSLQQYLCALRFIPIGLLPGPSRNQDLQQTLISTPDRAFFTCMQLSNPLLSSTMNRIHPGEIHRNLV